MSLGGGDKIITNTGTNTSAGSTTGSTTNTGTGSTTKTPWNGSLEELLASLQGLKDANAGALPGLTSAMQGGIDTATGLYGGSKLNLGDVTGALGKVLNGGSIGGITSGLEGVAGGALSRMLSGTPDYAGVQGAIDAANAPLLRDFDQNILPSLNSRATFLNNGTGGIKSLNRVLPDLGDRMSQNAATLTNAERLRALSDQTAGLGIFENAKGQDASQALAAAGLFPQLSQLGLIPDQLKTQLAGLPLDLAKDYSSAVLPYAGVGGTVTDEQTGTQNTTNSTTGTGTSTETSNQKGPGTTLGSVLGNGVALASLFGGDGTNGISGLINRITGRGAVDTDAIGAAQNGALTDFVSGGGAGAAALEGAGGLGAIGGTAAPAAAGVAGLGALGSGLADTAAITGGALDAAAAQSLAGVNAALGGGAAGSGVGSALLAAAPWVAGALAVGAVAANNIPKSSPLDDAFDLNTVSFSKGAHFDNTKFTAQELNAYLGPALKVFAQTGDAAKALASIPKPTTAKEQTMLKGGAKSLFGGTGNPFRVIAKAKGFGEGIWTKGNDGKKDAIKALGGGA